MMARYRYIVFQDQFSPNEKPVDFDSQDLSQIDGFIFGSEKFSRDTLRWMLPEMSEEKQQRTFCLILKNKALVAKRVGKIARIDVLEE